MDRARIRRMDNEIVSALIGAVAGSAVTGGAMLYQTRMLLKAERDRRQEENEQETQSVAVALLWEINQFYKVSIQNVNRALRMKSPSELGWYVKPQNLTFTVFESVADKIGLFDTDLVHSVVGYYGIAKAYMATFEDYRDAMESLRRGDQKATNSIAVTLLDQIKNYAKEFVPLTKAVTAALAERGKVPYTFDPPWTPEEEQRLSQATSSRQI